MNALAHRSSAFDVERVKGTSVFFEGISDVQGVPAWPIDNSISSERVSAIDELVELGELEHDWDGYGGLPISGEVRDNALLAVSRLPDGLPMPEIAPNSNGTISFDWESAHGQACLEIGKSRFSFFIKPPSGAPLLMDGLSRETMGIGEAVAYSLFPPLPASSLPVMVIAFDRRQLAPYRCGW